MLDKLHKKVDEIQAEIERLHDEAQEATDEAQVEINKQIENLLYQKEYLEKYIKEFLDNLEKDSKGFFEKYKYVVIGAVVVLGVGAALLLLI